MIFSFRDKERAGIHGCVESNCAEKYVLSLRIHLESAELGLCRGLVQGVAQ